MESLQHTSNLELLKYLVDIEARLGTAEIR